MSKYNKYQWAAWSIPDSGHPNTKARWQISLAWTNSKVPQAALESNLHKTTAKH